MMTRTNEDDLEDGLDPDLRKGVWRATTPWYLLSQGLAIERATHDNAIEGRATAGRLGQPYIILTIRPDAWTWAEGSGAYQKRPQGAWCTVSGVDLRPIVESVYDNAVFGPQPQDFDGRRS